VQFFFEPDWCSGKAVSTRITLTNDEPMGVAGLWAKWRSPSGETVHSFTMLTINADAHPLMRKFHKPQDEKRMIVIVPPERYDDWLQADASASGEFLKAWPADMLAASSPQTGLFN
jgi:putative SOS response-associated peptidase YedK